MTNEEIAKELTIAMTAKMVEPTPTKIFEAYREILQGLGRSADVVTLESIELHLNKQDYQNPLIAMLVFGGSVGIAGGAIAISAYSQANVSIETIHLWAWIITIVGVVIFAAACVALKRKRFQYKAYVSLGEYRLK